MNEETYFKQLREATYRAAERRYHQVRLSAIDDKAVNAALSGGYTWAWDDDENAHLAARFEVAIWENSQLTGLCRGKPIETLSKLCLEIVEAAPNVPRSGRSDILPIISACATIYARMIGASEIRLMEPTSKSRIRLYTRLGFRYVVAGNYLVKEV